MTSLPVWTKPRVLMLASFESDAASKSYNSTSPMPVVPFLPRNTAV